MMASSGPDRLLLLLPAVDGVSAEWEREKAEAAAVRPRLARPSDTDEEDVEAMGCRKSAELDV